MRPVPSASTRAEQAAGDLVRLTRHLEMTSAVQERILRAPDEQRLFEDACRLMVDVGGYRMAWVGLKGPAPRKAIVPVAQAGYGEGYLEAKRITWADDEHGRGPTGRAVRSGTPQVARDIARDRRFAPWRAEARQRGYASSAALPLHVGGEAGGVIGALMVYSSRRDAFDDRELALLERLADNLAYGVGALRDRRAREAAERRSRELGEAVEHAAWGVAFSTPDGARIARVNQAFARMHGADDPAHYEGMPVLDIYPPEEHARLRREVAEAERTGHHAFESRHLRVDGTEFPVLTDITPLRDADGRPAGRVVHVQDLTGREQARAERRLAKAREEEVRRLREADALRTRIMSEVAHELKNPLTPLRIQLALLRDAAGDDERFSHHVEVLERNVRRVVDLTEELLDASRLGAGRLPLRVQDVDLTARLREFVAGYTDVARRSGLALHCDVDDGIRVRADPGRLDQMLLNLLGNARKYTPPGGTVHVHARREDDSVRVEVEDTGVGVAPDALPRLFEPFGRGPRPPRPEDSSTGLGLYITNGLVALHGGSMGVESEGPGKGSTFWLTLPAA